MFSRYLSASHAKVLPTFGAHGAELGHFAGTMSGGGLVLGSLPSQREITIELIRAMPTRVTMFCEHDWLARLLAIRVAGFGAKVVIASEQPATWERFVNVIGGRRPIATVRSEHRSALPAPSVGAPLVVIDDADLSADTYAPRLAWQSTIHLRTGANEHTRHLVDASHVTLVCRLEADTANQVSAALGLGATGPRRIAALDPHEVLVVADRRVQRVAVTPTPTELLVL